MTSLRTTTRFWRSPEVVGWALCAPALLLYIVFFGGPALVGFIVSLHEWNGISSEMAFVGLANYARLLDQPRFWNALTVNLIVVVASVITQIPLGLGLALALSRKTLWTRIYRTMLFTPQALSVAAVALIWSLIYDPYRGPINRALELVCSECRPAWLGDTGTALPSALLASIWFSFGFNVLLFLAGLSAIPQEFYDAAHLESNNPAQILRYVTIPLLREPLLIAFVLAFSSAFGHLIGLFFLMTRGGPAGRTELLGIYMERSALQANQFGLSSAISIVMLLIVASVVVYPAIRVARERLEIQ